MPETPSTTPADWADSAGAVPWAALLQYFPRQKIGTYLRPLPEYNLIYVKNPKDGCSTILVWMDRLHTGEFDVEFTSVHKEHRLPAIGDVGRPLVRRMLSGSAYRFSFVRDPLRRFESVYWDKIVQKRLEWRPNLAASWGLNVGPEGVITFEQFLSVVEQQDPLSEMDPHWRPQHLNLMHPLVTYDRIGRLESFDADLRRIRAEAGLPEVPLDLRNPSPRSKSGSVFDGRPDLVRRVQEIYAKDFELYGY
jgi:hypothetical protein